MREFKGTPADYSNRENWMYFDEAPKFDVDLFYLYPTCVGRDCEEEIGVVNDKMKHGAKQSYLKGACAFSGYTNVFAPYYRQVSAVGIMKAPTADGLMETCWSNEPRTDVYAALDYYFEHCNNGRPFILAGHSQGSCMLKIVLSEYMKEHPEYMDRLVAVYAIGYYFPKAWFAENPQIKPATGEDDYGVLISWNTESDGCTAFNLPLSDGSFVINPLNWKIDETPAGVELNLGAVQVDKNTLEQTFTPGISDAQIDLKRGALICRSNSDYLPKNPIFGDKSFHMDDWALYYKNIEENGKKRIAAYLAAHK